MLTKSDHKKAPNELKNCSYPNQSTKNISMSDILNTDGSIFTVFRLFTEKIKKNNSGLSDWERIEIEEKLKKTVEELETLENIKLQLGRILDYDSLRKDGISSETISQYIKEDDETIEKAKKFTNKNLEIRKYMFGYPANMGNDTAVIQSLRHMETKLPLLNGCGDTYEHQNYGMDAKIDYEQPILNKMYKHLGLDLPKINVTEYIDKDGNKKKVVDYDGPWGYITPGGSESNKWGITNGLRKYPDATVYYSKAAHYSITKALKINFGKNGRDLTVNYYKSMPISTLKNSEKIDVEELVSKVKYNWEQKKEPAVIVLTWGTTKSGAVDDVEEISRRLKSLNVEFYIHLDAAMYGGISKNQTDAPVLPDLKKLGIDSVAISLHKYFGSNGVNSVVIAKTHPEGEYVDYIGVTDSTTSGSRTFSPFSTYQRVVETLERKSPNDYNKNVKIFEKLLKEKHIEFSREKNANTFIINKPDDDVCKKYQLSTFKENDIQKAHIIIFPYHSEKIMRELVEELSGNN